MNILFYTRTFGIGGVTIVTLTLANKFKQEGHNVTIWAFYEGKESSASRLVNGIDLIYGHGFRYCKQNVRSLRETVLKYDIDIIINQWGLPYIPIKVARKAMKGLNIKIVSVYHNAPAFNAKTQKIKTAISLTTNPARKILLRGLQWVVESFARASMRYNYQHCDLFLVLSESFVNEFKQFTRLKHPKHLLVQTNPITLDNPNNYQYSGSTKNKEILYVGRLDVVQKKVERAMCTWNFLERKFPDWRLTIVGDGSDKLHLMEMAKQLGLTRVFFEGFQSPVDYYKRASILILVSDFEGFPLVLPEAMSMGVVPVVYDSYAAVRDVIDDDINGLILPYHKNGYDAKEAAGMMAVLMEDTGRIGKMAVAAIGKSKSFSIDRIYEEWIEKLRTLLNIVKEV